MPSYAQERFLLRLGLEKLAVLFAVVVKQEGITGAEVEIDKTLRQWGWSVAERRRIREAADQNGGETPGTPGGETTGPKAPGPSRPSPVSPAVKPKSPDRGAQAHGLRQLRRASWSRGSTDNGRHHIHPATTS